MQQETHTSQPLTQGIRNLISLAKKIENSQVIIFKQLKPTVLPHVKILLGE